MNESYYEILIKNISDVDFVENDREVFFDSFNAMKIEAESPKSFEIIIKNAEHPEVAKKLLDILNLSTKNVDKIIYFLKHLDYISSNEEVLDWLMNLDSDFLNNILYYFKPFILGNVESFNKKDFPLYNYPIIRIMDYCLKNAYFEKFSVCTERLEDWTLEAYWKARKNLIEYCVKNNRNHPEFFLLFNRKDPSRVKKYITEENINILNLTYPICEKLISQNILPINLINCTSFFDVFKKISLQEQIKITELLEGYDYPEELINHLHKLFNKENIDKIENKRIDFVTSNILEVSPEYLIKIRDEIINSSYFKKFDVEKDGFWLFINDFFDASGELKYPISLTEGSYSKLKELYKKCFRYATESIVSSLYPLPKLTQKITYLDMDKYNILCRVQTLFDLSNLDESFNKRTFCGFSILTQDNFSHYPGAIIHGYYSKVTADLIAHIYPTDSLSSSWAKYRKDLTKKPNMLLDIDDLNALTYAYKTYCQLCLRTKTRENDILQQDAIICCGDVDEKSIKYAEENNKKVLVLKRNENTIEYNDDIYSHLH